METIIYSSDQLKKMNSFFKPLKKVYLFLPFLSKAENEMFTEKLNKELNVCGCETGKTFMASSILISVIYVLLKHYSFDRSISEYILFFSLFIFVSAMLGKFLGLLKAKLRIKKILTCINKLSF